jgi:hypothetical protein
VLDDLFGVEVGDWYQDEPGQKVWWLEVLNEKGLFLFSFDKEKIYNLFEDYPEKLTPEEKEIFDRENPYWAEFFKDRQ